MSIQDEAILEFLEESLENLDRYDQELLFLESNRASIDTINKIFRIVHTMKGTCGFFDFKKLESVSHLGENLLDSLRSSKLEVSEPIISVLLALGDALRIIIVSLRESGVEGDADFETLTAQLAQLNCPAEDSQLVETRAPVFSPATPHETSVHEAGEVDLDALFEQAKADYNATQSKPSPRESAHPAPQAPTEDSKKGEGADTALRVDINLLNKLMNLVGELVLARNRLLQFTKYHDDNDFVATSQALSLITSELQDGIMRTRMQPVGNVLNRFPRIVRDVAVTCGKQVNLILHGKETELDKTILEAIKDPLTHIIRNAVDHGIETPEERVQVGKGAEGSLTIAASQASDHVVIEISDDGKGLNSERIKQKAIERGIISFERAAQLSEREVQGLIFLPGFSTAEKVTNISGRGVGMDVVRSNIERVGGSVDVESTLGHGSVFTLKIPLTLAITPALIVSAGNRRFAIPQANLLELVRIERERVGELIEEIQSAKFYRLRGSLLPLVNLREELEFGESIESGSVNIVVVQGDEYCFGLVVDSVNDTEEIVVKPLGRLLRPIKAFSGVTIMGDGTLALILDVVGLARQASIRQKAVKQLEVESVTSAGERMQLLVFTVGQHQRAAVPLAQVHRLEKLAGVAIEKAEGRSVIQYRGGILPLVDLGEVLGGSPTDYRETVRVFVHNAGERSVGFVVDSIVDICAEAVALETSFGSTGMLGSAVIQGTVTDLLDLPALVAQTGLCLSHAEEGTWRS
jgi:two-component system chemotaxis sensor kinase CheA